MATYGTTFRRLRVGKNMTLKDLADEQVSIGFLSKFETDQSKISVGRLMHLLDKMHVTADEYFFAQHDGYDNPQIPERWSEMSVSNAVGELGSSFYYAAGLANRGRWEELVQWRKKLIADAKLTPTMSHWLDVDFVQLLLAQHRQEDVHPFVQRAITYLKQIDEWSIYELIVFNVFLSGMAVTDVQQLAQAAKRKLTSQSQLSEMARMHRGFLFTNFSYFMNVAHFDLAERMLEQMRDLHHQQTQQQMTGDFGMLILWCQGWLTYRNDDKQRGQAEMKDALTVMRLCEETSLWQLYSAFSDQIWQTDDDHLLHHSRLMA